MDICKLFWCGASAGLLIGVLALPSLAQNSPNSVVSPPVYSQPALTTAG